MRRRGAAPASSNAPAISTASTSASRGRSRQNAISLRRTRARRRNADRLHLEGGDDCHYPSSWYSKAKKPVRPPTAHGQPRRSDRMHQLGLAQILGYFRQDVEQKACAHATQNHLLHAAESEEAQATRKPPASPSQPAKMAVPEACDTAADSRRSQSPNFRTSGCSPAVAKRTRFRGSRNCCGPAPSVSVVASSQTRPDRPAAHRARIGGHP